MSPAVRAHVMKWSKHVRRMLATSRAEIMRGRIHTFPFCSSRRELWCVFDKFSEARNTEVTYSLVVMKTCAGISTYEMPPDGGAS